MEKCMKCGSKEIKVKFYNKGEKINVGCYNERTQFFKALTKKFCYHVGIDCYVTAKQDFIYHKCKTCGYQGTTLPLDEEKKDDK